MTSEFMGYLIFLNVKSAKPVLENKSDLMWPKIAYKVIYSNENFTIMLTFMEGFVKKGIAIEIIAKILEFHSFFSFLWNGHLKYLNQLL